MPICSLWLFKVVYANLIILHYKFINACKNSLKVNKVQNLKTYETKLSLF